MSKPKCATNPAQPEFTLCGDAADLCALDDADAVTPVFAKDGELVTCDICIRVIKECRSIKFRSRTDGE